jgi:hypothetical protein
VQAKGLDGTLTSGRAITKGSDITVVARWKVVGDVKVLFRSMHVDGTIDATLKGSKITGP